mmetsp:Transcript_45374/g.139937  ORF Transcript_45374/g.139937 Transcript_45374/m.139937 type:complete len:212 (-) Transcript_45374:220-855(-)
MVIATVAVPVIVSSVAVPVVIATMAVAVATAQAVRVAVGAAPRQDRGAREVDDEAEDADDDHGLRLDRLARDVRLPQLPAGQRRALVDAAQAREGLDDDGADESPDGEDGRQGADHLGAVVPVRVHVVGALRRCVQRVQGENECTDVGEKVRGVREDGETVRHVAADDLDAHEDEAEHGGDADGLHLALLAVVHLGIASRGAAGVRGVDLH